MVAKLKPAPQLHYAAEEKREIAAFFNQLIASGVKAARIAHEAGISEAELGTFLDGEADLQTCAALDNFQIQIIDAADSGGFIKIPSHKKIGAAFENARAPRVGLRTDSAKAPRGVALVFGAAGFGKTTFAEWYAEQENRYQGIHKYPVLLIEVPGGWRSRKVMLQAIVEALERQGYSRPWADPEKAITDAIPAGGIIIFDQAHRLSTARIDELSYFTDQLAIGVALMGNLTGYAEICNGKLDSITRRVNGHPVHLALPAEEDILAILKASEISGPGIAEHALMVGAQACGIAYLFSTVHAAKLMAAANGVPVDLEIFKAAALHVGAWGGGAK